jgi:hypothetical protein
MDLLKTYDTMYNMELHDDLWWFNCCKKKKLVIEVVTDEKYTNMYVKNMYI